uniref:DUF569 domain-containing protein n=1 Tax=Leersia perrieri TaxID=77586 RepID=A0A0D9WM70_9ORYZ
MDEFPDRQHVWLQSSDNEGMYLTAADGGIGVYLQPDRASLHAAWLVHLADSDSGEDGHNLMLHSAANGRYLAATTKGPWRWKNNRPFEPY